MTNMPRIIEEYRFMSGCKKEENAGTPGKKQTKSGSAYVYVLGKKMIGT